MTPHTGSGREREGGRERRKTEGKVDHNYIHLRDLQYISGRETHLEKVKERLQAYLHCLILQRGIICHKRPSATEREGGTGYLRLVEDERLEEMEEKEGVLKDVLVVSVPEL